MIIVNIEVSLYKGDHHLHNRKAWSEIFVAVAVSVF